MISEIKDGRAYTQDDNKYFTDLPGKEQQIVLSWIKENLHPRNTPLLTHTSYGLKHVLEQQINVYMTNNQFKDAMLICGYHPVNANNLNWSYCLSKRSPAFRR